MNFFNKEERLKRVIIIDKEFEEKFEEFKKALNEFYDEYEEFKQVFIKFYNEYPTYKYKPDEHSFFLRITRECCMNILELQAGTRGYDKEKNRLIFKFENPEITQDNLIILIINMAVALNIAAQRSKIGIEIHETCSQSMIRIIGFYIKE
jgi:hypothetical protein